MSSFRLAHRCAPRPSYNPDRPRFGLPKRAQSVGSTNRVSSVALTSPPITIVASGLLPLGARTKGLMIKSPCFSLFINHLVCKLVLHSHLMA